MLFFKKALYWKYSSNGLFFQEARVLLGEGSPQLGKEQRSAERAYKQAIGEITLHQHELSREQQQYWQQESQKVSREIEGILNPDIAETVAQRFLEKVEYYTGPVLSIMQKIGQSCEGFGDEYLAKKVLKAAQKVSDSTEMSRYQKLKLLNDIFSSSHIFGTTWSGSYQLIKAHSEIGGGKRAVFSRREQEQYDEELRNAVHGDRKTVDPLAATKRLTEVQKKILEKKKERDALLKKGERAMETKKKILTEIGYLESLGSWDELAQEFSTLSQAFPEEHPLAEFFASHAQESVESIQIALSEGMAQIETQYSIAQTISSSWEDARDKYAELRQKLRWVPVSHRKKTALLYKKIKEAQELCILHTEGKKMVGDIQERRTSLERNPSATKEEYIQLLQDLQSLPPDIQKARKKDIETEQKAIETAMQRLEGNEDEGSVDLEALASENADISSLLIAFDLWRLQSESEETSASTELPSLTTKEEIGASARKQIKETLMRKEENERETTNPLSQTQKEQEFEAEAPDAIVLQNEEGESIEEQDIAVGGIAEGDLHINAPKSSNGEIRVQLREEQHVHEVDLEENAIKRGTNSERAQTLSDALEKRSQIRFTKTERVFNDGELVIGELANRIDRLAKGPSRKEEIKRALWERKQGSTKEEQVRAQITRLREMSN